MLAVLENLYATSTLFSHPLIKVQCAHEAVCHNGSGTVLVF